MKREMRGIREREEQVEGSDKWGRERKVGYTVGHTD